MIGSETEYQEARTRMDAESERLAGDERDWKAKGYSAKEIAALREPLEAFHMQLVEEVQSYERLKRGQIGEFENLHGLGQALIGLRIARGMSQRELGGRRGVDESSVSRDECNEYHGITVERAKRVLDALGVRLVTTAEVEPIQARGETEHSSTQPV